MTLMEKIVKLTPEQREKLDSVKDEAALVAFAAENEIELTDGDKKAALSYFETGVVSMSDDDMEAVAGGSQKSDSEKEAQADGRIYNLPGGNNLCGCHSKNKWARSETFIGTTWSGTDFAKTYRYDDIKCYKCKNCWASKEIVC